MEILTKGHKKFWTEAENLLFEEAVKKHGVDKDKIHKMFPTRTVRSIKGRLDLVRGDKMIIDPEVYKIIKRKTKKKESWS